MQVSHLVMAELLAKNQSIQESEQKPRKDEKRGSVKTSPTRIDPETINYESKMDRRAECYIARKIEKKENPQNRTNCTTKERSVE